MTTPTTPAASYERSSATLDLARERHDRDARQAYLFMGLSVALAGGAALLSTTLGAGLPFVLALGPLAIALVLAWRTGSARALLGSATRRPTDGRWYAALLVPFLVALAAAPIAAVIGEPNAGLFGKLTPTALILPLIVFLPALAEELAWRGFATERLLGTWPPLASALIVAIPWGAMHLPLYLAGQPYDGSALWPSLMTIAAGSILFTYIYVGTGGSVLMTTLFHTAHNAATSLTWSVEPDLAWAIRPLILAVLAIVTVVVVGRTGPRVRQPADVR
jgi:membrane protease YdiL (CAAX protease family)